MLYGTLWSEVATNFPTANQGRCKMAVNWSYHEWLAARQWSYRESTTASIALTAGVKTYVLLGTSPVVPDFDGLISVGLEMNTGGSIDPMFEFLQPDFDRFTARMITNGEPTFYCLRGGTPSATSATINQGGQQVIQITPPPLATADHGQALKLAYFRSVASMEMTADTDIPLLPAQYHPALILGANAYMSEAIGNVQKAAAWRQLFQQRIAEAIKSDEGMRGRDRVLLVQQQGASIYPITGQTPETYDPSTRPYDRAS
jgi:hypothetical protein